MKAEWEIGGAGDLEMECSHFRFAGESKKSLF